MQFQKSSWIRSAIVFAMIFGFAAAIEVSQQCRF
jgi:hypothetical protein